MSSDSAVSNVKVHASPPAMAGFYSVGFGLAGLLAVVSFMFWDKPLAHWAHGYRESFFHRFMQWVTELGEGVYWLVPSALIGLWCLFVRKNKQAAAAWAVAFASLALTGIVTNILKVLIGRYRPKGMIDHREHIDGQPLWGFDPASVGYVVNSMPSGHATTCGCVAALMWLYLPGFRWIGVPLMLVVASSRVWVTAHYISDVAAGLYVGAALTILIYQCAVKCGWIDMPPAWRACGSDGLCRPV